jgi:plastocyanin
MVHIRTLGIVAALSGGLALASCAETERTSDRPPPRTYTVNMEGMAFTPEVLTVAAGDTIVWINKDLVAHTATSTAAGFDSKIVDVRKSWRHTVDREGDFDYVCSLHPTMTAKLHVK